MPDNSPKQYLLGARKDNYDIRDYNISSFLETDQDLPDQVDYTDSMLEIRDQGEEGCCVAMAACAVKDFQEQYQTSPRFIFNFIEQPQGGAYPKDALDILLKQGVCGEYQLPFIPNKKNQAITREICNAAKINKIKGYARLYSVDDMLDTLYQLGPFMISFGVSKPWFTPNKKGLIEPMGEVLGGHEVCMVGYDKSSQIFKFKNSWGKGWGKGGYGYISFADTMRTFWDAHSIIDIPEPEEEKANPTPEPSPEPTPKPPQPTPDPEPAYPTNFLDIIWSYMKRLWNWIKRM